WLPYQSAVLPASAVTTAFSGSLLLSSVYTYRGLTGSPSTSASDAITSSQSRTPSITPSCQERSSLYSRRSARAASVLRASPRRCTSVGERRPRFWGGGAIWQPRAGAG